MLEQVDPDLSVVLPVFRTRDAIRELHRGLVTVLERMGEAFEIVFVDDASPDGSFAKLQRVAAADPRVVAIRLARNVGQHRAVLSGLIEARGRRFVVMDADLQDPPEAIPLLLGELDCARAAAVFAGRRGRYESPSRLVTSRLFKGALHVLTGVPRDAGLFVAMDRRMRDALLAYEVERPFLVAMMGCTGLPTVSIPVERMPRPGGGSSYTAFGRLAIGVRAVRWTVARRLGIPSRSGSVVPVAVDARAGARSGQPAATPAGTPS